MRKLFAVALLALIALGYGVHTVRVAAEFPDPVGGIRAQDESLYTHCAIHMATCGGWLTPTFLGRYLLYKPPLLAWLSGLSLKAFGISLLALRLPVLLAGALTAALVFAWARHLRPNAPLAGILAVLLLLSNRLWHTFSRICQTDVLVAASIAGALFCLARDSRLARRTNLLGFGICAAGAILSKSVAGLIPLLVLLVASLLLNNDLRPSASRVVQATLLVVALAAPWHIYQLAAHAQWFWADYVQLQLLGFGVKPPAQVSPEGHLLFYAKRLFLTDPLLSMLALAALPSLLIAVRRRETPSAAVLLAWVLVSIAGLFAFRYRNLHYVLPLVPALCLLSGCFCPLAFAKGRALLLAGLSVAFAAKVGFPASPWGLPYGELRPIPAARLLREYCEKGRPNELILVAPDDEFYSAALPLPRVRYFFVDPENRTRAYGPHFEYLGITVSARQFVEIEALRETFRRRLQAWGLNSVEPLATAIVGRQQAELLDVIRARPDADFYVPADWRRLVEPVAIPTHVLIEAGDRVFLLARGSPPAEPRPPWTLPSRW